MMAGDGVLDDWVGFAISLADESRRLQQADLSVIGERNIKPDRTFVTALDLRIEERLRHLIAERYPGHGIVGEEHAPLLPDAELVWVLDPIDGTAAFIAGMPVHSTLIALAENSEPVVGIIDVPAIDSRWIGARGRRTTRNGKACQVRSGGALSAAIMSTSSPDFYAPHERPALDAMRDATGWRIYGGAALSYGRLADGRIDVALDAGLKIHDYAPFRPVIEGAGGTVTDWRGRTITLSSGSRILAAGDRALHAEILGRIDDLKLPD